MSVDRDEEIRQLKNDFFNLEIQFNEEKQSLARMIQTLARLFSNDETIGTEFKQIAGFIDEGKSISDKSVENVLDQIKNKIMVSETSKDLSPEKTEENIYSKSLYSENLKKIILILVNEFYPLNDSLLIKAHQLKAVAQGTVGENEIESVTSTFLEYIEGLKSIIAFDYQTINNNVCGLVNQFKELEQILISELSPERNLENIDGFEEQFNGEFDSLVASIDPISSITEVKEIITSKMETIKNALSVWKTNEKKKAEEANQNIKKLKDRISEVEKDASTLSRLAKKFKSESSIDKLTGLFNRSAFDVKLQKNLRLFHETKEPFALIIFDVDRFKEINDTFGHVAGDKILFGIAKCLIESFRENDFIARFGGDEFVAIIDGFTNIMAETRIDLFRENLKKLKFTSRKKGEVIVTVSAGIATPKKNDISQDVIDRADQAMYLDKQKEQ